jgi:hypothetical protein
MPTNQAPRLDAVAEVQTQLIHAAKLRLSRRRRQRLLVAIAAGTLLVVVSVGVAAIHTDIVGPPPVPQPFYEQEGNDRVDATTSEGLDRSWTFTVYRNRSAGLCIAAAPSIEHASRIVCGSAFITAAQLENRPLNGMRADLAQVNGETERVVISGLAASDVTAINVAFSDGSNVQVPVGQTLFSMPITKFDGTNGGELKVHPLLMPVSAPVGATTVSLTAETDRGKSDTWVYPIHPTIP